MPYPNPKVLLVEDDTSMREAVERLLGAAGFECEAYASAEALLEESGREGALCVVSDLKLPAMSGLGLLDEVHSRGWTLPMILITAHDAPGRREEAREHGAVAYLVKPFRGTALLEAIRSLSAPGRLPNGSGTPETDH
jgi:FixJ family two-component response regulator